MTTIPREAELWRRVFYSKLLDVHTALPGKVEAFDATTQTVDVQPMIKNVLSDLEGNELEESYPILREVPVQYPRSGAFVMAWPLEVGDFVTLIFNEWSIDAFREKGRETHPIDYQRHSFSGAIAIPGGPYPNAEPITETLDGLVVGNDGGALVRIKDDGTITLGATSAVKQPIALGDDTKSEIDALRSTVNSLVTDFNSHVHPGVTSGAASTGTIAVPASAPAAVGDVGSSKVEVEE